MHVLFLAVGVVVVVIDAYVSVFGVYVSLLLVSAVWNRCGYRS